MSDGVLPAAIFLLALACVLVGMLTNRKFGHPTFFVPTKAKENDTLVLERGSIQDRSIRRGPPPSAAAAAGTAAMTDAGNDSTGFADLPAVVVVEHISSFLSPAGLVRAAPVCSTLFQASDSDLLWRFHYARVFGREAATLAMPEGRAQQHRHYQHHHHHHHHHHPEQYRLSVEGFADGLGCASAAGEQDERRQQQQLRQQQQHQQQRPPPYSPSSLPGIDDDNSGAVLPPQLALSDRPTICNALVRNKPRFGRFPRRSGPALPDDVHAIVAKEDREVGSLGARSAPGKNGESEGGASTNGTTSPPSPSSLSSSLWREAFFRAHRAHPRHLLGLASPSTSCVVIIHGRVYDLTDFARSHPGGSMILREHASTDATDAFESFYHSREARRIARRFVVWDGERVMGRRGTLWRVARRKEQKPAVSDRTFVP